jgi:uncharacterized protein (DUF1778 family)
VDTMVFMKKAKVEQKSESIRLRVTAEEKAQLEAVAAKKHLSLSRWLVIAGLGALDER